MIRIVVIPTAVMLILGMTSCGKHAAEPPQEKAAALSPGEVKIDSTSEQSKYLSVETVGTNAVRTVAVLPAQIVMNEDQTVRILTPVAGRVSKIDVQNGDRVTPGTPLAHIASSDLSQAQSDLAKAEAALTQAKANRDRSRDLFSHNVIARRDLEQAESDEAQAQAERDRALERTQLLGTAGDSVGQTFILRSPIKGEVVERAINPGQEVRPDNGQALFTVTNLDTVWLLAHIYQRDLNLVYPGQKLRFTTDACPGETFEAKVDYVSSALDSTTRTATLRAVMANPNYRLRTQVYGEARLLGKPDSQFVAVPTKALVTHGESVTVFIESPKGHYTRRTVSVGTDDGQIATITSGLKAGERVVTRGSLLLEAEADQSR